MKRIFLIIGLCCALAGCSASKNENLKSPCVGVEGSPCGPKKSVNDWWQA